MVSPNPSPKTPHHRHRRRHTNTRRPSKSKPKPKPKSPNHRPPPSPLETLSPLLHQISSLLSLSSLFLSKSSPLLLPSSHSLLSSSLSSLHLLLPLLPPLFPLLPSPHFQQFFRMSRPSFDLLLENLNSPSPSPQPPLSETDLAAALFRLAHAATYRSVAHLFHLPSPESACRAFYLFCQAVISRLGNLFDVSDEAPVGFGGMSLPDCCGVLGFFRFRLDNSGVKSLIAQLLVDSEGRFLDVSVGWNGDMSPADIVANSRLCKEKSGAGGGSGYVLGGSCCPLLPWLITPFGNEDNELNQSKCGEFNAVHAQGMELVERAFRGVRGRWKLLQTFWKEELAEALPYVVVASCLLHNYLIKCGEPMPDEIGADCAEKGFSDYGGKADKDGEKIREMLALQLSHAKE